MSTRKEQVQKTGIELLKVNVNGLRFSELVAEIKKKLPDVPENTINGGMWNLDATHPKFVHKPSRGLFKYRFDEKEIVAEASPPSPSIEEGDFYESFADWIKNELGECTAAAALGGNCLGKKWGTPDVIGSYRPSKRDVVQFQPEIISAEVKISPHDPITAFGQAIAYRLFSSKVYLVEPNTMAPEDLDRIEALCGLFGIGFIICDIDPKKPNYSIRMRAQKYSPDMFFVNEMADKLFDVKKEIFDAIFG